MKKIRILHLTDLHFGSSSKVLSSGIEDAPLSPAFIRDVKGANVHDQFLSFIRYLNNNEKIDIIAFTGDLGVGIYKSSIGDGIDFLERLAKIIGVTSDNVIVCPGNHDLDREATYGNELEEFYNKCKERKFSFPDRTGPAIIDSFGPPIIALNSCLGGTEHAPYEEIPKELWKLIEEKLNELEEKINAKEIIDKVKEESRYQLKALDIPAIGVTQLDTTIDVLTKNSGNCAVILMHHNLLPINKTIFRPYANLIDAGRFIQRLIERGHRIVLLHGHTHCDSGLSAFLHQEEKMGGFIATIGSKGFPNETNASANLLELQFTKANVFSKLKVAYIERNGDEFLNRYQYELYDRHKQFDAVFESHIVTRLERNKCYSFNQVADLCEMVPNNDLEEKLISLEPDILNITGQYSNDINSLNITRIR
jgi:3',5'-cyclic AMP phosphodiesterase CpdA